MTFADLSIKQISREVAADLELDQEDMVGDLSVLWQGAASQSDTINFALYKLANPDEDKPDEKSVKKVLSTIASMSTLVGASMGSPILATSSFYYCKYVYISWCKYGESYFGYKFNYWR